jgi:hypothetical protein
MKEMVLTDQVSDEALEAAAFSALGGFPTLLYGTYCFACPSDPLRDRAKLTEAVPTELDH